MQDEEQELRPIRTEAELQAWLDAFRSFACTPDVDRLLVEAATRNWETSYRLLEHMDGKAHRVLSIGLAVSSVLIAAINREFLDRAYFLVFAPLLLGTVLALLAQWVGNIHTPSSTRLLLRRLPSEAGPSSWLSADLFASDRRMTWLLARKSRLVWVGQLCVFVGLVVAAALTYWS